MSKNKSTNNHSKSRRAKYKTEPYPLEFRESAVKLALESNGPVAHIADDLGISHGTLYNWVSKATHKNSGSFDGYNGNNVKSVFRNSNSHIKTEEENKRLKAELEKVTEECDLLKKAAAYFARDAQ